MNSALLSASTPLASISCLRGNYVSLQWKPAEATDDQLRAVYEQALHLMKAHATPRLLSDHRLRPPLSLTIQQWLREEWIPRAMREAGYSHCAIVESANPMGRLAARAIGMGAPETLTSQYFDAPEPAGAWLERFAFAA
jgi:hypothetical protein